MSGRRSNFSKDWKRDRRSKPFNTEGEEEEEEAAEVEEEENETLLLLLLLLTRMLLSSLHVVFATLDA